MAPSPNKNMHFSPLKESVSLQRSLSETPSMQIRQRRKLISPSSVTSLNSLKYNSPSPTSFGNNVKETNKVLLGYDPISKKQILNNYEIIKDLGTGQHGKVKLAKDTRTGELVAIKIVNRYEKRRHSLTPNAQSSLDRIKKEIAIMKKCNHEHIVKLIEILDDLKSRKIYLVLEYCKKGEIKWCPREQLEIDSAGPPQMSFQRAREILRDVILGLECLHHQGIIHRDIKPANLLIDHDDVVKISDFGVSLAATGSIDNNDDELELTKTVGTPVFFSPEICLGTEAIEKFNLERSSFSNVSCISFKIDIWALGITLYCLLFGKLPFVSEFELKLFDKIVNDPVTFPDFEVLQNNNISNIASFEEYELAKDLLERLLDKNPTSRISIQDIKKHPFVCFDFDHITNKVGEIIQYKQQEKSIFQMSQNDKSDQISISSKEIRNAISALKRDSKGSILEDDKPLDGSSINSPTISINTSNNSLYSPKYLNNSKNSSDNIYNLEFNNVAKESVIVPYPIVEEAPSKTALQEELEQFDQQFEKKTIVDLPVDSSFASLDSFYAETHASSKSDFNKHISNISQRNASRLRFTQSPSFAMNPFRSPFERSESRFGSTSFSQRNTNVRSVDPQRNQSDTYSSNGKSLATSPIGVSPKFGSNENADKSKEIFPNSNTNPRYDSENSGNENNIFNGFVALDERSVGQSSTRTSSSYSTYSPGYEIHPPYEQFGIDSDNVSVLSLGDLNRKFSPNKFSTNAKSSSESENSEDDSEELVLRVGNSRHSRRQNLAPSNSISTKPFGASSILIHGSSDNKKEKLTILDSESSDHFKLTVKKIL
ncbi:serine/threonine protein kinase TOS3 NDAI_0G03470 [Naumovozyma dairenensis CBS 421]|uniref:non-specific serine/threonine protein kinase n=1 Tax=Naumovozyma dairenensis (strain ATCC 10597 / BCRC 20456 / CBS 421 / NBRC 0211 / NRRL Y-12639) TaxID=1071378 RepID=G0WEB3_NAUDC|nr:hypothetical protein NDAI_0G03470 [Naumovozyma dairenensis CBS 421]CCD26124.2 hypothetical protein NDAI_0G03470 [Naumovozyma dairenensis CBS 421]